MAFEIPSDLHPQLMPLAWLLGAWHGNGRSEYPDTEPHAFEQDVMFTHDGRDFVHYFSQSWITDESGERTGVRRQRQRRRRDYRLVRWLRPCHFAGSYPFR
ncbi:MAG: DUF1794 domain-containing protein [Aeromicrobium sp.]|nr:MAG: DUF1794 domain-containing protein [Aeromicrobium sp.]